MNDFEIECKNYDTDITNAKIELAKLAILPAPGGEQDLETWMAIYWGVLKDELSPVNITKVCKASMRGSVSISKFRPTPGEMVQYGHKWFQKNDPVLSNPRINGPARPSLPKPDRHLVSNNLSPQAMAAISKGFKDLIADLAKSKAFPR